jgi:hypothetical protein
VFVKQVPWVPCDRQDPGAFAMHWRGTTALTKENPFDPFERGHPHWHLLRHTRHSKGGDPDEWPEVLQVRQWPEVA